MCRVGALCGALIRFHLAGGIIRGLEDELVCNVDRLQTRQVRQQVWKITFLKVLWIVLYTFFKFLVIPAMYNHVTETQL